MQATSAYEDARDKVARLINAKSSREIVFTPNATAGLNLVAQSWGRSNLGPGDEVYLWNALLSLYKDGTDLVVLPRRCMLLWPLDRQGAWHAKAAACEILSHATSCVMQVVVSVAEHHSNLVPWQMACQATGATLRVVPLTKDTQEIDMQVLSQFHSVIVSY